MKFFEHDCRYIGILIVFNFYLYYINPHKPNSNTRKMLQLHATFPFVAVFISFVAGSACVVAIMKSTSQAVSYMHYEQFVNLLGFLVFVSGIESAVRLLANGLLQVIT